MSREAVARALTRGPRRAALLRGRAYHLALPETFGARMRIGKGVVFDEPQRMRLAAGVIIADHGMFACQQVRAEQEPCIQVGPRTFFNRGCIVSSTGAGIRIGVDVLFGPYVCVVDDDHAFSDRHVAIARQGMSARGPVVVGDGAWIATGAVLLGGTVIPPGSVVAANAVVRGEFPQRAVIAGAPARVVKLLD